MQKMKWSRFFRLNWFIVLLSILILSGCGNVFEWMNPQNPGSSAEDYMTRADRYFMKQDYPAAADSYNKALQINPSASKARMGYVKSKLWLVLPDVMVEAGEWRPGSHLACRARVGRSILG